MKITLAITSLDCGGAERVAAAVANEWAAGGNAVSVITFQEKDKEPFFKLDSAVTLFNLGLSRPGRGIIGKLSFNLKKILFLRKTILRQGPDVVISFMGQTNVSAIMALLGTKIPLIVTEHVDSRIYSSGIIWDFLMRVLYPFAVSLVAVSKGVLESFPVYIRKKGTVIYNPITVSSIEQPSMPGGSAKKIIGMGRLNELKGFDLLLGAFSLIKDKNPSWSVEVWGEGEQRGELEALRDKLGLGERFKFPGVTGEPYKQFAKADLFVLSSRCEGFGIVLCEAMSQGLPAVSFDCPNGPAEIIRDKVDGILVPPEDIEALAKAMDHLMNNEAERKHMGLLAREVNERFKMSVIMPQWDKLIENILSRPK